MDIASAVLLNLLVAVCPKLPYEQKFNVEIRPGLQITIMGQANKAYRKGLVSPEQEPGFIINLNGDDDAKGHRILHVNPRFDTESTLVLNSRKDSEWGPSEQRVKHHMAGDKDFVLVIQAHENEFKIYENGKHLADFKYREPLKTITGIAIKGLVNVHQFIAARYHLRSLRVPQIYNASDVTVQEGFPITAQNPILPYDVSIPKNMQVGMVVAVVGTPLDSTSFSISWMTKDGNVALTFNPQLTADPQVVINSYSNGMWNPKWVYAKSLFYVNKPFYLLVKTRSTHYEMWLNGVHYGDFQHRLMPLTDVNKIAIYKEYGNIKIDNITITY